MVLRSICCNESLVSQSSYIFLCAGIFLMLLVDVVFVPTYAPFVVTPYSFNIYISYYNKPSDHLKVLAPFGSDAHAPLRPTYSTMWFPFIHKKFGPSLKRQKYFRAIKFVDEIAVPAPEPAMKT